MTIPSALAFRRASAMLFDQSWGAMNKSEFFNSAQTWSKRKHRLLGKYLVPFSAKVGRLSSDIFCIDGFAGQGRYADGTEGSPLLMAHVADECQSWANPIRLLLINVEANRTNYKKLCSHRALGHARRGKQRARAVWRSRTENTLDDR